MLVLGFAVLAGCSAKVDGQRCSYPSGSYYDGTWEKDAVILVRKPRFLFWQLEPEVTLTISSSDGLENHVEILPREYAAATNLSCSWLGGNRVKLLVEFATNSPQSGDLPNSYVFELSAGQWVGQ